MRILPDDAKGIAEAGGLLATGRLVAFPTETVYGLGADATNDLAVAAIFAAKDRPEFNPLIVHVADAGRAAELVEFDARARTLAEAFWPGPLTLVLPRRKDCKASLLCSAGLDSLGVRAPDHALAHALIEAAGCAIAAPSANLSGTISPTSADDVAASLKGRVDAVLDGGRCRVGIESTVISLCAEKPVLLRPGGIPAEDIEAHVGPLLPAGAGAPRSPGMLERHYAPNRPLRTNADFAAADEALLAFGPDLPQYAPARTRNLSPAGDLAEAAANLFAMLRELDHEPTRAIAVMRIPNEGLGRAINDRLRRAAAAFDDNPAAIAGGCGAVVDPFELGD